ncbi:hypothetical protein, partial [Shewanella algae]|uniref:hypothetical protein n=1 Tax=Shewanella algae TaxID=38313 RepID=UPI00313D1E3A
CDWDLIDYLPEPLLRREFDLHMLYLDKQETSQDVNTTATTESDDWTDAQRYYDTLRSAERNQSSEPASGS